MNVRVNEFSSERKWDLADKVLRFREEPVKTMRDVAGNSADGIKALKTPIRAFARSGVKLTTVAQTAVQNLIELESDVITSTLTAAAMRFERAAQAEGVIDLVFDQAAMMGGTRDRIVDHATRAVGLLKDTGRDLRGVARHAYDIVVKTTDENVPEVSRAAREVKREVKREVRQVKREVRHVKRAVRKTTARVRKTTARLRTTTARSPRTTTPRARKTTPRVRKTTVRASKTTVSKTTTPRVRKTTVRTRKTTVRARKAAAA